MGCFSCFDSNEEEHLNPVGRQEKPNLVESNRVSRVSSEANRAKERSAIGSRKESLSPNDPNDPNDGVNAKIAAQVFTFQELAAATKNFDPECFLGEGGFGRVYKGFLESTGQVVAVKQLDRNGLQGNREFLVEVLMLSLVDHPNLVNLIGYCADGDQRLLVYEYMPLGSLEDHLHYLKDKEPLDWNRRMKIAAGAAKGLEYLHDKIKPPVIYRDFKSSNILLGEGFHPKLSDFGLAKLGPLGDKSHVSTRVMGTYGYCAPEYAMTGQLTIKSDVYSFGVFFLELITGRKAIDGTKPAAEQNLVKWGSLKVPRTRLLHVDCSSMASLLYSLPNIRNSQDIAVLWPIRATILTVEKQITCLRESHKPKHDHALSSITMNGFVQARPLLNDRRKYSEIADPRLDGQYPHRGLYQALAVASMCLQEQATTRPLIADVVTALSYLASQTFDPYKTTPRKITVNSEVDEKRSRHASSDGHENMTERKARYGENESGFNWDLDRSDKDDSPKETARILGPDSGRQRAVAEAKMWGENLREKRRAGALGGN